MGYSISDSIEHGKLKIDYTIQGRPKEEARKLSALLEEEIPELAEQVSPPEVASERFDLEELTAWKLQKHLRRFGPLRSNQCSLFIEALSNQHGDDLGDIESFEELGDAIEEIRVRGRSVSSEDVREYIDGGRSEE